ncbi:hypothetical protein GGP41_010421 [Bipolaris sorokiniana]|uniref:Uncharacterized protein n=2 Tax=Cochliobolus sativus TaxID=45130 RepID=A0A8H6DY22_COCSA|nr:uncharacterized protein COCSADRAFT_35581 [Bipolaris sorokiniana ND90Pr]EMD65540.1 hypothetical protein COCSADRAFT_35581 [Bipolaris sorokiniana ND90Pr]KAF5850755.1 hypothetical protein GGP41_010421 [Bipolaris sorokiniana]
MAFDTEVLIIGAGMSGLGLAVQLIRTYNLRTFEIVEKSEDVGGTWNVNTYPGCGCDVASHFYSYSFALNPDWSRKYSHQREIQAYFQDVAEQYRVLEHIRFHSTVEKAAWNEKDKMWEVEVLDWKTKGKTVRRAKILVSGVGALSVPKECDIPGAEVYKGRLFHSAKWDHGFDWGGKDVVVLGNGCSATQFVPILANPPNPTRTLIQFSRQAQFLSERQNPVYSDTFKVIMRYVPLAMRLYRLKFYLDMERDYSGFSIDSGHAIRQALAKENAAYVKNVAPPRYWDALIPTVEVGCKRKVLDTDYLKTLWRENVELIFDDAVARISETGVVTREGREIRADAIVLATGFKTQQMLVPMEIVGRDGVGLREYWDKTSRGVAQAYFGTVVPHFPNFFILMGPNTVTGHLSVIYSVECQINFILRLLDPIIKSLPSYRLRSWVPSFFAAAPASVEVKSGAAAADSRWTQDAAKKLVWATGCVNWAVDAKTGLNNMMYPDWQFMFWLRSVFWKKNDFIYLDKETGREVNPHARKTALRLVTVAAVASGALLGRHWIRDELPRRLKDFDTRALLKSLKG